MQSRRSLSFLSVLLLLFTQLGSALPNPAAKELEVRVAGPEAAPVDIAARWDDNNNYGGDNYGNSPPPPPDGNNHPPPPPDNNNPPAPPTPDGKNHPPPPPERKYDDCNGDDSCWHVYQNNDCDGNCWNNGHGFITFIQQRIIYEFGMIRQFGDQISYDDCNNHINNIRGYIGQLRDQTSSRGLQWYGGDIGGIQHEISGTIDIINTLIYYLSVTVDVNIYGSILPPLCGEVGDWFHVTNNVGVSITTEVSTSISYFTQVSSNFGVVISL
ncbi:hypothetical protein MPER_08385 [Moniliophthora perniciosa FA553]|nr:hypothetical protein MPER_08385 [Moniliophthora perniciosa FA553]